MASSSRARAVVLESGATEVFIPDRDNQRIDFEVHSGALIVRDIWYIPDVVRGGVRKVFAPGTWRTAE